MHCVSISLEEVTSFVGREPTLVVREGSRCRPGAAVANATLWVYAGPACPDSQPASVVRNLLAELPNAPSFKALGERAIAWIGLDCRMFTTAPPLSFPAEVIAELERRGLGLDIDII